MTGERATVAAMSVFESSAAADRVLTASTVSPRSRRFPAPKAVEGVTGTPQNPGQDHRFPLRELGPREQLAEVEEDAANRRVARETDVDEEPLEAPEEPFDLPRRSALDRTR